MLYTIAVVLLILSLEAQLRCPRRRRARPGGLHAARGSSGMLGRGRGAAVARHEVEDGAHLLEHAVALGQHPAIFQRDPGALVLAVAALHLLVHALLHFALEDPRSRGLVVVGNLENVRSAI